MGDNGILFRALAMKRTNLVWIAALALCSQAHCMGAELTFQQLNHKGWTVADGAPGAIFAITQTQDGTLWLAGPSGLTRFDGIHFVRYDGSMGRESQSTDISALAAPADGSLWIGYTLGGISVLQRDHSLRYGEPEGLPRSGAVNKILMEQGAISYAATSQGLYQFDGNRWRNVAVLPGDPTAAVTTATIDREGTLWALTNDHVWARRVGEASFTAVEERHNPIRIHSNVLASGPDGQMWVLNLNRTGAIAKVGAPDQRHEIVFPDATPNPGMIFDRDGNLWIGGAAVRRASPSTLASATTAPMDAFTAAEGLTGDRVTCFFEDREGNMWAGTYSGLDRFSHSNVIRVKSTNTFGAAVAGADGTVWVSGLDTGPDARYPLLAIRDGVIVDRLSDEHFTSGYRGSDGAIWFGGRSGLARLAAGRRSATIPLPYDEAVQTMVQDNSGAMWVSISRKGLFRFAEGRWTSEADFADLPQGVPIAATLDQIGRVLLGYSGDRIARLSGNSVEHFGRSEGLNVGNVTSIAARHQDVWIGGDEGLAHFDGIRFVALSSAEGNPFTGISGIVAPEGGDLWLNGNAGIVHLARAELQRAIGDAQYRVQVELFDRLDGLHGYARQLRPSPSAFEGSDGYIWFATQVGLVGINPARIERNPLAPPVTIWSIEGRSVQYPAAEPPTLPKYTTHVRIEYTASSLQIPERVRFRYRLDGLDKEWQDVGDRREATYTNLGPGRYSFRVVAANNDGVWNNAGATLTFSIAPAFYQTNWFYGLCLLLAFGLLWLLYKVRIRQVSLRVRARLEERLAERERIARDLHDTLLQSVQGLVLRFRAAVSRLPQEPARSAMEQALDRADGVLAEGRDAVKQLRSAPEGDLELSQAIAAFGEELAREEACHFKSTIEGMPRELHPIVREEVMLIAREALVNAFKHGAARKIEAETSYGDSELTLRIRDDGRGIDTDVQRAGGKAGHWGLLGMRERAQKVRGTLTLWSKPGAGTEIEVRVPARMAYQPKKRVNLRENLASTLL
jgi:signal transduction histidine kinase/ligand-binding sensor domain-containing protein